MVFSNYMKAIQFSAKDKNIMSDKETILANGKNNTG